MDYQCLRSTTFDIVQASLRHSMFPLLKIKFNLFLQTQRSNYSGPRLLETLPSSNYNTTAEVVVQEYLSYADVRDVLREAIGDRLLDNEHQRATWLAWREVWKSFQAETLYKYAILTLDFKILIRLRHVYAVERDYPGMVPAADSSLGLLEKCDGVGCVREADQEGCCCICLEEIGGVALRMPCSHVFHGRCIEEWLRTSHYCPLCRYKMPTKKRMRSSVS